MAWTVKNDNHETAVIAHFVHQGVPVIIHDGGRYPSLVNEEGVNTYDHPVVEVITYSDYVLIEASSGRRLGGSTPSALISKLPLREKAAEALIALCRPYLDEAVARTAIVYDEWVAARDKLASIPSNDLTREDYLALCAEYGVTPYSEKELSGDLDVNFGAFSYPEYPIETCISAKLSFWRRSGLRAERSVADVARRAAATVAIQDRIARLRCLPVSSTATRRVPASSTPLIGQEHLDRQGRLLTVIASVGKGRISDDDPSIHGEHLLGHEGERAFDVTYEIRDEIV